VVGENGNGDSRPIAVLVGATGAGKTTMAVDLADWLRERGISIEIVGADARQIYRSFSVGTAKPTVSEQEAAPHHMLDVADPNETYNAVRYAEEARRCVDKIFSRRGFPLIVGGSGLYIRALVNGLFRGPGADFDLRRRLEVWSDREGIAALHDRLSECDPVAAAKVHPNDRKRLIRALEVFETTGRPISELHSEERSSGFTQTFYLGIEWSPELHARRIEARVRQMLIGGMREEASSLAMADLTKVQLFEGLGYGDALALHKGEIGMEDCVGRICKLHRRYAKRQRTWFQKIDDVFWLEPAEKNWNILVEAAGEALCAFFLDSKSQQMRRNRRSGAG